jgi:hypothetical protein
VARQRPGSGKGAAITGQPAGQHHPAWQAVGKSLNEGAAIDLHALAQHEHVDQLRLCQRPTQAPAGRPGILHVRQIRHRKPQPRLAEVQGRDDDFTVGHAAGPNFTGGGATRQLGLWKDFFQDLEQAWGRQRLHRAKNQHKLGRDLDQRGKIGRQRYPGNTSLTNVHDEVSLCFRRGWPPGNQMVSAGRARRSR